MREVVIAGTSRTAIEKYSGTLKEIPVVGLGTVVLKKVIEQAGNRSDEVNEVIIGQVLQVGTDQNTARQTLLKSAIPIEENV